MRATQGRRQILTTSRLHPGEPHPAVVRELVALEAPTLADARADRERLLSALGARELPLGVLRHLPETLRDDGFRATVTRYEGRPIDVEPADVDGPAYGTAVDIGTSKIIAYLFDLESGRQIDQEALENPQMRFGEDVITRLTQAITTGASTICAGRRAAA